MVRLAGAAERGRLWPGIRREAPGVPAREVAGGVLCETGGFGAGRGGEVLCNGGGGALRLL
jgi:hypothetical protein